jgi:hypothetical protein
MNKRKKGTERSFFFNSFFFISSYEATESLFLTIETGISNFGQVVQATSKTETTNADHKKALKTRNKYIILNVKGTGNFAHMRS